MHSAARITAKAFETIVHYEDYCVRDHRVHGIRILPGVFLLDLLYRTVESQGVPYQEIELRNIVFYEPIATSEEYDRAIRIAIEPEADHWKANIQSRNIHRQTKKTEEEWRTNCFAEVHLVDALSLTSISLELHTGAPVTDTIETLYAYARSLQIEHFEFMKIQGTLHRGPDYLMADARLSSLGREYLPSFLTHPAYLDFATLLPFSVLQDNGVTIGSQPFIPIFIDRFRIHGSLGEQCYVHVKDTDISHLSSEMIRATFHLCDGKGNVLVSFDGFSAKRIRQDQLIARLIEESGQEEQTPLRKVPESAEKPAHESREVKEIPASSYQLAEEAVGKLVLTRLEDATKQLDSDSPFYEHGLESVDLLYLVKEIESLIETKLYPTLLFEYTTIRELATYLSEQYPQYFSAVQPTGIAMPEVSVSHFKREDDFEAGSAALPMESIAIIGLAGRYPHANNVEEFWEQLLQGRDSITETPGTRWDIESYFSSEKGVPGRTYSKWGGFMEGHDQFDSLFFSISPHEAAMMDPHERLFLEVAWETIEDAGYTRERLQQVAPSNGKGASVGVFAGVMWGDYQLFGWESSLQGKPAVAGSWFSSVANRVSYFLNLNGPSLPVDTACSSSLYAIHLAAESIRRGECRMAIAGGVNLSLHPYKYVRLSELQMLSGRGRCHTFGDQADGYVPGEGVGAVLLKPLGDALRDGDNIYAVLRGSAVNHNGRTSGYSVPSPEGQARLLLDALDKANVSARTISLIEAHGTGTALGDPIEISGLTAAFRRDTPDTMYCSIGSVKSNIGHLEAAAGIAGLTKALLCMRHQTFVPSLHSSTLNPNLNIDTTPFYVQQKAEIWKRMKETDDGQVIEIPRRAGISSFGAGGTNMHLIVEEYVPKPIAREAQIKPEMIILSAKNMERLKSYAKRLLTFVEKHEQIDLRDLAYTLQVGREAMNARMAIVANSLQEVKEGLSSFVHERASTVIIRSGHVKGNSVSARSNSLEYLSNNGLEQLAELWVQGAEIKWQQIFADRVATCISLPTYPFAPKRVWIKSEAFTGTSIQLHPLIDQNISTLDTTRFAKSFSENQFFIADHQVKGEKILPGVVYLEMARSAAAIATEKEIVHLTSIKWQVPVSFDSEAKSIMTVLKKRGDSIAFTIESGDPNQPVVHAKGEIKHKPDPFKKSMQSGDLAAIKNRCQTAVSHTSAYGKLERLGLHYGERMRGMTEAWVGKEEALVRLALPDQLSDGANDFVLHPTVLDGAFQSISTLMDDAESGGALFLPFAVDEITIDGKTPAIAYVHVRKAGERGKERFFDVDVYDESGVQKVQIRGLSVHQVSQNLAEPNNIWLYEACWSPQILEGHVTSPPRSLVVISHERERYEKIARKQKDFCTQTIWVKPSDAFRFVGSGIYEVNLSRLEDVRLLFSHIENHISLLPNRILFLPAVSAMFDSASQEMMASNTMLETTMAIFLLEKALLEKKPKEEVKLISLYENNQEQPHIGATGGLARSIRIENPRLTCRVIRVAGLPIGCDSVEDLILKEFSLGTETEVLYTDAGRFARTHAPVKPRQSQEQLPLRKQGVYVITGGAGALGQVFALHLAKQVSAKLVLLGRSPLTQDKKEAISSIEAAGGEVLYVQADVANPIDVEKAILHAVDTFGSIHGVIHSAGVIEDALLLNKEPASFERVWNGKVNGVLALDWATREQPLDFFVAFSSTASVMGNVGQSDYAAANRFLDLFSLVREGWTKEGKRKGHSLSINWPLWREGGMTIAPEVETIILKSAGLRPLETAPALAAFEYGLSLSASQLLIVDGEKEKVEDRLTAAAGVTVIRNRHEQLQAETVVATTPAREVVSVQRVQKLPELEKRIALIWSELIGVSWEEFDPDDNIAEYGVDSIMTMRFLDRLEVQENVSLSPSVLSEFPSIRDLATHLLMTHSIDQPTEDIQHIQPSLDHEAVSPSPHHTADDRIAVIGMASRFPQSPSLQAYWAHLRSGSNLVTEVPKERWNVDEVYAAEKGVAGRTYCKFGSFLDGIEDFAAVFFGISDEDAKWMDPQQRILLEITQHLLDQAGYEKEEVRGTRTGVFIGAAPNDYVRSRSATQEQMSKHLLVNTLQNMIAARVSDFYDWHGPSQTIDSACSSSLVAIHEACKCLRTHEADMVVAGGVELLLDSFVHVSLSQVQALAEDGQTRVFDRNSNGFTVGEGVGAVLLKRLEDAVRDGDQILAVINGSAVNNDGATPSLTMPNQRAQTEVIQQAIKTSGVNVEGISYLEMHGSANRLGDPIEVLAATEAYSLFTSKKNFCGVGSVKSNLGNLLHAGGIAAFIKVMLALKHKEIPPTIHLKEVDARLAFENSPFYPVQELRPWTPVEGMRRAGISSFGFGGTNCHVIVEEFQAQEGSYKPRRKPLEKTNFVRQRYWLEKTATSLPAPIAKTTSIATLQEEIAVFLTEKVADMRGVRAEQVDRMEHLLDAGVSSIQLLQLADELERAWEITLHPTVFFDYLCIEALSKYIAQTFSPKLSRPEFVSASAPIPEVAVTSENVEQPLKQEEQIAVIGMAGMIGGTPDLQAFWQAMSTGVDLVKEIPEDRWRLWGNTEELADIREKLSCRWGSFIENMDHFDARFFQISPREAETMDPQIRLFLQTIYAAAEDAAVTKMIRGSKTGVYAAACFRDYEQELIRQEIAIGPYDGTGSAAAMMANRASYYLDLKGPSLTVDTACSSSLVALHLASQALRSGDCEMAFVGGVNLMLSPRHFQYFSEMGALSKSGRCHSFDEKADGYVPAESIVAVLLKPLSQAIRDGDRIHGIIEGSAISHGGQTTSLTAPSPREQTRVIMEAWKKAKIDPATIGYIEAHGTGTKLGDPIEVEALSLAFGQVTNKPNVCVLGSTKSHIGHAEAAAGLTGVIRTLLSMQADLIPVMPNFKKLNPYVRLEGSPLSINHEPLRWPQQPDHVRRAAVSSFGFGGANAHVVIRNYEPPLFNLKEQEQEHVFPLSARTEAQLKIQATRLRDWLRGMQDVSLQRIAHTLQIGREEMERRVAIVASSHEELLACLDTYVKRETLHSQNMYQGQAQQSLSHRANGDVHELARSWVEGASVHWPTLNIHPRPVAVSLPTYPFSPESFWFTEVHEEKGLTTETAEICYFTPVWEQQEVTFSKPSGSQSLVIFSENCDTTSILCSAKGLIAVIPGDKLEQVGPQLFSIRPQVTEDYHRMWKKLEAAGLSVANVVLIANTRGVTEASQNTEMFMGVLRAGAQQQERSSDKLAVSYVFPKTDSMNRAYHWSVAGIAQSVASEIPSISFRILEVSSGESDTAHMIESGLSVVNDPHRVEEVTVDDIHLARRIKALPATTKVNSLPALREKGIVLITGGAGGLGLLVARHLAEKKKARLVLTGRSPLDEQKKSILADLEKLGGEAIYLQANLSDEEQMKACVAYTRSCFGPIDGVIQAAGVIGQEIRLSNLGMDELERIGSAKIKGTIVLDRVTREEPLQFFLLFSSVSTVLRTSGQAAYARANRFLDAFAEVREYQRKQGNCSGHTLSVNWPYWREGGMRMNEVQEFSIVSATGFQPLPAEKGIEALWTSLQLAQQHSLHQIIVAYGERQRVQASLTQPGIIRTNVTNQPPKSPYNEQEQSEQVGHLAEELSRMVIKLLRLRTDRINPEEDLTELGLESMTITELSMSIRDKFGITVHPPVFYEHRTLQSLSKFLTKSFGLRVQSGVSKSSKVEPALSQQSVEKQLPPTVQKGSEIISEDDTAIAVIGMGGSFPGSTNLADYWRHIENGDDLITSFPMERFNREALQEKGAEIASYRAGFISDVDKFDPLFFGISPYEAEMMDPQQRIFIETVWSSMEDAGYRPSDLAGQKIGVFAGISNVDYADLLAEHGQDMESHIVTGLSHAVLPNRVSYLLDVHGPSEAIDTGCSSSLVAVNRAIKAIRQGECVAAFAGGVNLLLSPKPFIACSRAGMLSVDGRCHTFDIKANGYVRGEGAGVVLLKPLKQAIADGDQIHGILRGSSVNHGGRAIQGLTAPNPLAQANCLIEAYEDAKVKPQTITYLETHGTGTALGDPIEINGLKKAFQHFDNGETTRPYCGIGTVKTNIGHLESASGIAGLIKVLLAMKNRKLPIHINYSDTNPYLEIEQSPFYVVKNTMEWHQVTDQEGRPIPRRAGVSSFGFGGVNAHVVVEEAPATFEDHVSRGQSTGNTVLLPFSAQTEEQLDEVAKRMKAFLEEKVVTKAQLMLEDVAFTLQIGREPMEYRMAIIAGSVENAISLLDSFLHKKEGDPNVFIGSGVNPSLVSLFSQSNEGRVFMEELVARGKWQEIARMWTEGVPMNWEVLHRDKNRKRMSLPTYPFARRHCWIESKSAKNESPQEQILSTRTEVATAAAVHPTDHPSHSDEEGAIMSFVEIREYLIRIFEEELKLDRAEINPGATFDRYGLDSLTGLKMVKRMEQDLGHLPKTLLLEYATIEGVALALAEKVRMHSPVQPESDTELQESPPLTRDNSTSYTGNEVVIVGMGGVFPGSETLDDFWENLQACKDLITEIPKDRFDWQQVFGDPRNEKDKTNSRWGGFIENIDSFDPRFFRITPAEAELMDPQQRLFLRVVYQAIENAGYRPTSLAGTSTGVFVGVSAFDYNEVLQRCGRQNEAYAPTGLSHAILANRISFLLDLRGPSEPVDTACSSSLVAIHRAVRAIETGDCDAALAGGVNALLTPQLYIAFAQAGFLSPDGRCKPFDSQANGYVRGEGAGVVMLKRLSNALADGDHIYAVIKGSGVNHGGRVQSLTVPSAHAQADLVTRVYKEAGVDAATVTYIEAHGTGTPLGDPLEISGLTRAFTSLEQSSSTPRQHACQLGSVKANIGHLESAAGVAGMIKVLLALKHRRIPGVVHYQEKNHFIELDETLFAISSETTEWEALLDEDGRLLPRRAGISSFGFGGSNAHMLLEEFMEPENAADATIVSELDTPALIVLSARSEQILREYVEALRKWSVEHKEMYTTKELTHVAYTLSIGREAMPVRVAFLVHSMEELAHRCLCYLQNAIDKNVFVRESVTQIEDVIQARELKELLAAKGYEAVARRWVEGAEIEWDEFYQGSSMRRIPLPSYPFAKVRCWAEPQAEREAAQKITTISSEKELEAMLLSMKQGNISIEEVAQLLGE